MQTIINAHARQRDRYIHRRRDRRVTPKVRRVGGIGVGVLAVEVALAAEVFVAASMAPAWFSLMVSLCKPCGGREVLCVQEVQAHCRNKSIASTPQHHHPRPLPQCHTYRCKGLWQRRWDARVHYGRAHQKARGRVKTKQRGSRRRQQERREGGGHIERESFAVRIAEDI